MHTLTSAEPVIPVFKRWFGTWQISVARRAYTSQQLSRFYDGEAARWDRTISRLGYRDAYRNICAQLARRAEFDVSGPPVQALDAGIGTGALSLALLEEVRRPLALAGVDVSTRMLDAAGAKLSERGCVAALTHGSICSLPYEDDTFDLVMSAHVLEHLPDPVAALGELKRVLRPGGMLMACITRRSRLGAYVQWKWHTHQISPLEGKRWFRTCGLQAIRVLPFRKGTLNRRASIAYIGRKPAPSSGDRVEPAP
ncbi:MAG: class I SAM-dependent methyltransferase [Pseudomonadota bacterium]